MLTASPLISVTLPNYNYGQFLPQAFESVLRQSYTNFEILFTDDGSTDNSIEIARKFAARDRRIRPVYFPHNRGAQAAHANTWGRTRGEIIYQFSSDDYIVDADFFRRGVEAMTQYPQAAGFFGVAGIMVVETNQVTWTMGKAQPVGYIPPAQFLRGFLTEGFFVPGISALWRKNEILAVGGYDHRLGPQSDYFINHALSARGGVVFDPTVVAHARTSTQRKTYSGSASVTEELQRFALFAAKMKAATQGVPVTEAEWAAWREGRAKEFIHRHGRACLDVLSTQSGS